MEYCWLSWKQASHPFSKKTLEYIKSIDIMKDIETLNNQYKFRPICLRNMRLSSTILKKGAAAGLTLEEIGKIWCRTDDEGVEPSIFEKIVERANWRVNSMQGSKHLLSNLKGDFEDIHMIKSSSIDMETYERIEAINNTKIDKEKLPEKRQRSNTTIEDEDITIKKATFDKMISENVLATVKENYIEEEKGYENNFDESTKFELVKKDNSVSGNIKSDFAFPKFNRAVSISSNLSVNIYTKLRN